MLGMEKSFELYTVTVAQSFETLSLIPFAVILVFNIST
jgi:hypothetical protein